MAQEGNESSPGRVIMARGLFRMRKRRRPGGGRVNVGEMLSRSRGETEECLPGRSGPAEPRDCLQTATAIRRSDSSLAHTVPPQMGTGFALADLMTRSAVGLLVEKWQGLGNDFLLCWDRPPLSPSQIGFLCHRQFGVGGDGILFLRRQADTLAIQLFNQDGSGAEYSGNGFRCAVASAVLRKRPRGRLNLVCGRLSLQAFVDGQDPILVLDPKIFDFRVIPAPRELCIGGPLDGLVEPDRAFLVKAGNPHLILLVDQIKTVRSAESDRIFDRLREPGSAFPEGMNVSLAESLGSGRYALNTWERGVGQTQACASAATALFFLLRTTGRAGENVEVVNPGGALNLSEEQGSIRLRGPVRRVFSAMVDPLEQVQG